MLIKIDFRETELYTACTNFLTLPENAKINTNVKILNCSIPLGDIIICDDSEIQDEKIIIERKTLNDLAASIRDGRYAEQSFRLNECNIPNHNIFYAIEGDLRQYKSTYFSKNKLDKKSLLSALTSIHYYKGFSVMRTLNVIETAEWILQMADKIQREQLKKELKPFYISSMTTKEGDPAPAPAPTTQYSSVLVNKRIKKDNVTPENIGEIMLTQIPGVSANVAIAVMKKYGTIKNLMDALKMTDGANDPLTEIVISEDGNKKPRKLNKTNIANIYKYLIQ